jgi:elongation factor Ts
MANYSLDDVKKLREFTGAGMMDAKKALDEADGNYDEAVKVIRKKGQKKVATRADREAREGLVAVNIDGTKGFVIELNSETDFVAKSDKFVALGNEIVELVAKNDAANLDEALKISTEDGTLADTIINQGAAFGEKVELKKVEKIEGDKLTTYAHKTAKDLPPAIAVIVATDGGDEDEIKSVAQHIAALNPKYTSIEDIPADIIATEKEIASSKIPAGKPENIIEKILEGSLKKFYQEVVLLEQPLAKDDSITVQQALDKAGATLKGFVRVRVGE